MGKRKLTRKQIERIQKKQADKARGIEKQTVTNAQGHNENLGPEQEGLVLANYGPKIEIESLENKNTIYQCHLRSNLPDIVTGDRVIWRKQKSDTGVVVAILPRTSSLCRPDNHGHLRPVAANIDYIFIVISPAPAFHLELIDRYLVAAEITGIEPVLLMNKSDLLTGREKKQAQSALDLYEQIGYASIVVSANTGEGITTLEKKLNNHSSIFAGQSGVGKSSLVNRLLPAADAKVGKLSPLTEKGRHTTTTSRLFHLPCGGRLTDSPGIRRFGLWHMKPEEVIYGFREFSPFIGQCKFSNCKHTHEPDCALLAAVKEDKISVSRWASYQSIINSL